MAQRKPPDKRAKLQELRSEAADADAYALGRAWGIPVGARNRLVLRKAEEAEEKEESLELIELIWDGYDEWEESEKFSRDVVPSLVQLGRTLFGHSTIRPSHEDYYLREVREEYRQGWMIGVAEGAGLKK